MSASVRTVDGTPISRVALGATGTGTAQGATAEGDTARIRLFRSALDLGVTVFDTAELYGGGYSEQLLGRAFGGRRESVFICSKFNPDHATAAGIEQAVEGSLRRLGTDYIDLYQLHWPSPFVPFEETWGALSRLIDAGKVRFFGAGNCSHREFLEYRRVSGDRIAAVELPFNVSEPDAALPFLPWATGGGKMIFAYSPLGQGRLCRSQVAEPAVSAIMQRHRVSENQLALAWIMSFPNVVPVFQTGSTQHLKENLSAASITLAAEEIRVLQAAYAAATSEVPLSRIVPPPLDGSAGYACQEEAAANAFDWIPSPALLAERIRRGDPPYPLRLVGPDPEGCYRPDGYDLRGEMKKYWAWRMVRDEAAPVPAYVFDSQRTR